MTAALVPEPMVVESTLTSSATTTTTTATAMMAATTTTNAFSTTAKAFSTTTAVAATNGFPTTTTTAATTNSTTTTTTPNSKSVRTISMKENARELMNCKRRLDFNHTNYLPLHRPQTVAVARRNERERNRVKLINMTFATLREHIPNGPKGSKNKKMSKVETLRAAIDYIHYLQDLVEDSDTVNTIFDSSCLTAAGLTAAGLTNGIYQTTAMNSPRPSSCSDSSYEGLSAEEEELLGFTKWF
ncbi:achaete-scute homolog 1a-like [Octopus sinensis]|nr:achaete-scute homolog 1a-like [Octopus sinensis]